MFLLYKPVINSQEKNSDENVKTRQFHKSVQGNDEAIIGKSIYHGLNQDDADNRIASSDKIKDQQKKSNDRIQICEKHNEVITSRQEIGAAHCENLENSQINIGETPNVGRHRPCLQISTNIPTPESKVIQSNNETAHITNTTQFHQACSSSILNQSNQTPSSPQPRPPPTTPTSGQVHSVNSELGHFESLQNRVHDLRLRARNRVKRRVKYVKDKIDQYYDTLPWVIGATSRLLGIKFAPIHIPVERRLQTFALMWWMSCFVVLGVGSWLLFYYLLFYTQYWWIVLCYITWFYADMDITSRGGRRSNWMRNWKIWQYKRDFYPAHLIKTSELPPDKNYVMGFHPHGILASGAFCNFATEANGFSEKFPGITPALVTLKLNFLVPLYRDYILMTGAIDSSKESIENKLSERPGGTAVLIVVGGAREALDCHPGTATLTLKNRKGFCKIALRKGADLVPIYSFGENEVYGQVHNPQGSWMRRIQELLLKYCGVAPCLFFGRGMLQYSFGIIPYRRPIYTVVGAPIPVTKVDNPTREQVEELHSKYVESLVKLYNDHREQYALDPTVDIVIK